MATAYDGATRRGITGRRPSPTSFAYPRSRAGVSLRKSTSRGSAASAVSSSPARSCVTAPRRGAQGGAESGGSAPPTNPPAGVGAPYGLTYLWHRHVPRLEVLDELHQLFGGHFLVVGRAGRVWHAELDDSPLRSRVCHDSSRLAALMPECRAVPWSGGVVSGDAMQSRSDAPRTFACRPWPPRRRSRSGAPTSGRTARPSVSGAWVDLDPRAMQGVPVRAVLVVAPPRTGAAATAHAHPGSGNSRSILPPGRPARGCGRGGD